MCIRTHSWAQSVYVGIDIILFVTCICTYVRCKVNMPDFKQHPIPNISIFYPIRSITSRPQNAVSYLVCKDQEYELQVIIA